MRLSVFLLLAAFAAQISDRPAAGQAGGLPRLRRWRSRWIRSDTLPARPRWRGGGRIAGERFTVRRASAAPWSFAENLRAGGRRRHRDKVQGRFLGFQDRRQVLHRSSRRRRSGILHRADVYSRAFYLAMRAFYGSAAARRGLGARFSALKTRRLPPGRRLARIVRQDRPAPVGQRLA